MRTPAPPGGWQARCLDSSKGREDEALAARGQRGEVSDDSYTQLGFTQARGHPSHVRRPYLSAELTRPRATLELRNVRSDLGTQRPCPVLPVRFLRSLVSLCVQPLLNSSQSAQATMTIPQAGWLKPWKFILPVPRAGLSPRSRCSRGCFPVRPPWLVDGRLLTVSSLGFSSACAERACSSVPFSP